ncbi:hypothetical protein B0H19DRAFT_1084189 [Mycena capillaripes]|nr:hypothetical protein B0H19DRAFT_1084189 [Mycena capillaripes]
MKFDALVSLAVMYFVTVVSAAPAPGQIIIDISVPVGLRYSNHFLLLIELSRPSMVWAVISSVQEISKENPNSGETVGIAFRNILSVPVLYLIFFFWWPTGRSDDLVETSTG